MLTETEFIVLRTISARKSLSKLALHHNMSLRTVLETIDKHGAGILSNNGAYGVSLNPDVLYFFGHPRTPCFWKHSADRDFTALLGTSPIMHWPYGSTIAEILKLMDARALSANSGDWRD